MSHTMIKQIAEYKTFGGWTRTYVHPSEACSCEMTFSVIHPPMKNIEPLPVLYWLSGLTCTNENFITKAAAQKYANDAGLLLVVPDTSPRGAGIEGEEDDWDLGTGAGFYINATMPKWASHYRMYDYVSEELPQTIQANFPVLPGKESISGHSMGGHGALTIALKNPKRFSSISAFAPICAPSQVPWGIKAFTNYLGGDPEEWKQHDANALMQQTTIKTPILIDQGDQDSFLAEQLKPELFQKSCEAQGYPATIRMQPGYDHSYYFIATFIEDHIRFHQKHLTA